MWYLIQLRAETETELCVDVFKYTQALEFSIYDERPRHTGVKKHTAFTKEINLKIFSHDHYLASHNYGKM